MTQRRDHQIWYCFLIIGIMYRNNNKQTANQQNRSRFYVQTYQPLINNLDVQLIQSLSVLLDQTEAMGAIDLRDIKSMQNKQQITKVVRCSITSKKIDKHQLLNQFGAKVQPLKNETVKHSNIVTQFTNLVKSSSPSKNIIPKLTPKSNTSYLSSAYSNNKKSQTKQIVQKFVTINPPAAQQQQYQHQQQQYHPAQQLNSAKQSTMTFSPLRINISLPSLCSEDLQEYSDQKQIITDIQNDIQVLINKIKSNHCTQSPNSKANHMFNRNVNTNNCDVININVNGRIRPNQVQMQTDSNNNNPRNNKVDSNKNYYFNQTLNSSSNKKPQTVYQNHQQNKKSINNSYNNNNNSYAYAYNNKKSIK